jgi:hypothetical protein
MGRAGTESFLFGFCFLRAPVVLALILLVRGILNGDKTNWGGAEGKP